MKEIFCSSISFCILLLASCGVEKQSGDYQLVGKFTNTNGETVTLVDVNTSEMKVIDSAVIDENGEFHFSKKIPEKGFYNVQVSPSNFTTLVLDSTGQVVLEGDDKNIGETAKITGSKDSELFFKLNLSLKKIHIPMNALMQKQDSISRVFQAFLNLNKNQISIDSLSEAIEPIFDSLSEQLQQLREKEEFLVKNFIDQNPSSFACLAAVQRLNVEEDLGYYEKVARSVQAAYPGIQHLKGFYAFIETAKRLTVGSSAPEIVMDNPHGNPIALSSLKGKIVLVNFWASWCKPCRQENPFIVSLYKKYHGKGFDIYSVSLDKTKEEWIKAIKKDELLWKNHVCDFMFWQAPVVQLYNVKSIPFVVLLDKSGNIAAKNLHGKELENKIISLLQQP